jgi:hypothetical protein
MDPASVGRLSRLAGTTSGLGIVIGVTEAIHRHTREIEEEVPAILSSERRWPYGVAHGDGRWLASEASVGPNIYTAFAVSFSRSSLFTA